MKNLIKNILKANLDNQNDYKKLIFNLIHRIELFSTFLVFALLVIEYFIHQNFSPHIIVLFLCFIYLALTSSISFKYYKIKIALFALLLYAGGVYFILNGYNYVLLLYVLIIYIAYLTNRVISLINLIIVILSILLLNDMIIINIKDTSFISENTFIVSFIIICALSSYLVNNFATSFKNKFKENEKNVKKIIFDNQKYMLLNKQLISEAEKREKVQDNLELSLLRFKTIFDEASDSIIILDAEENILEVNKTGLMRYNLSEEVIKSMKYRDLVSDDMKSLLAERIKKVIENKFAIFESEHISREGEIVYVENRVSYIEYSQFKFLINISRDISERKRKEKEAEEIESQLREMVLERTSQLEDAMTELRIEIEEKIRTELELIKTKTELEKSLVMEREYNTLRNRFVSMISHEYRTPLTVILSSTYILEHYFKVQDNENFNKNINKIQSSVQAMTNLLEDVIRIGKAETQLLQVDLNKFDILETVKDIFSEMKSIDKVNHNYKLECEYRQLIINSDERLQNLIIRDIVKNASKFSEKDTNIIIQIFIIDSILTIIISDEGIGIPEKDMKHLFEPFFRGGNIGAKEGTGLGLSLIKRYVSTLNGTIEVNSIENKGTTIKLTYPLTSYEIR